MPREKQPKDRTTRIGVVRFDTSTGDFDEALDVPEPQAVAASAKILLLGRVELLEDVRQMLVQDAASVVLDRQEDATEARRICCQRDIDVTSFWRFIADSRFVRIDSRLFSIRHPNM